MGERGSYLEFMTRAMAPFAVKVCAGDEDRSVPGTGLEKAAAAWRSVRLSQGFRLSEFGPQNQHGAAATIKSGSSLWSSGDLLYEFPFMMDGLSRPNGDIEFKF